MRLCTRWRCPGARPGRNTRLPEVRTRPRTSAGCAGWRRTLSRSRRCPRCPARQPGERTRTPRNAAAATCPAGAGPSAWPARVARRRTDQSRAPRGGRGCIHRYARDWLAAPPPRPARSDQCSPAPARSPPARRTARPGGIGKTVPLAGCSCCRDAPTRPRARPTVRPPRRPRARSSAASARCARPPPRSAPHPPPQSARRHHPARRGRCPRPRPPWGRGLPGRQRAHPRRPPAVVRTRPGAAHAVLQACPVPCW